MKLTNEQLKSVLTGVTEYLWEEDGVVLHRFKAPQREQYTYDADYYAHAHRSSAMTLDFHTDASALRLKVGGFRGRLRNNLPFELYVDGVLEIRRRMVLPQDFSRKDLSLTPMELEFALPEGEHRITVYFPWHITVKLYEAELTDASVLRPHEYKGRWLALGDSITHGYDVAPSFSYVMQTARLLDYRVVNHGISGAYFGGEHLVEEESEDYDLVTVAFGTNDYAHGNWETMVSSMEELFSRLHRRYAHARVVILLPTWRKSETTVFENATLPEVRECIAKVAAKYPGFSVVDCRGFVPHHRDFFGEAACLHPNELGATHYAMHLANALKELMSK